MLLPSSKTDALRLALALFSARLLASCGRSAPTAVAEPPRVYEQAGCAEVMHIPGMTSDQVVEGVVSIGITAVQNRQRAVAAWNQQHRGHWVRWSLLVDPRTEDMRQHQVVRVRCVDGDGALGLEGLNDAAGAAVLRLQGGERIHVEGWLDERSLVLGTTLRAASLSIEAAAPSSSPPRLVSLPRGSSATRTPASSRGEPVAAKGLSSQPSMR